MSRRALPLPPPIGIQTFPPTAQRARSIDQASTEPMWSWRGYRRCRLGVDTEDNCPHRTIRVTRPRVREPRTGVDDPVRDRPRFSRFHDHRTCRPATVNAARGWRGLAACPRPRQHRRARVEPVEGYVWLARARRSPGRGWRTDCAPPVGRVVGWPGGNLSNGGSHGIQDAG